MVDMDLSKGCAICEGDLDLNTRVVEHEEEEYCICYRCFRNLIRLGMIRTA